MSKIIIILIADESNILQLRLIVLRLDAFLCCQLSVQIWKDDNLAWNMTEFENITFIVVNAESIWIPDVIIKNRFVHRSIDRCKRDIHPCIWTDRQTCRETNTQIGRHTSILTGTQTD